MTRQQGTIAMPTHQPTWTIERVELLKSRFAAGLSCREIAADIGVSRNAVIGKLSRLDLTRENTADAPRPARRDAAKGARPRSVPRLQYQILRTVYAAQPPEAEDEPIPNGHCCSLLELSEQRCRWPISTPGAADFCFCGNVPVEGLPYCAGHARLAYRPGSRQRVARG
jgi:GcrA cell cycle regulator